MERVVPANVLTKKQQEDIFKSPKNFQEKKMKAVEEITIYGGTSS